MHPHTKFGIPTSKNIGDMHRTESGRDGLADGRTDGWRNGQSNYYIPPTVPLCAQNSFVKKAELMITANPVCVYSKSLYKA